MYSSDEVIIYKNRIVILPSLRPTCLTCCSSRYFSHDSKSSITNDIQASRANCQHCNRMALSLVALPPMPPIPPEYPFQCVRADYFHYQGHTYLVIVDYYSNWPIVERVNNRAQGLIKTLHHTFATYGIPDELSSDGGPEFVAHYTREFLRQWGIHHCLRSVTFPHSNCRGEVGVKTVHHGLSSVALPRSNCRAEVGVKTIKRLIPPTSRRQSVDPKPNRPTPEQMGPNWHSH